ncbi:hypothetical protein F4804DRAFT_325578 [Jackrogersella minutella]|nr:hypothetical protein F4804DRAFT_325578 [Jackrogersella minutella]
MNDFLIFVVILQVRATSGQVRSISMESFGYSDTQFIAKGNGILTIADAFQLTNLLKARGSSDVGNFWCFPLGLRTRLLGQSFAPSKPRAPAKF